MTINFFVMVTFVTTWGWSGGAMVLGKLPAPGRPTIWITVGQGPTVLSVGAGGGCLDIFTLIYPSFPLSPSLWETARYRLKYCLKGPLNPKHPTNQRNNILSLFIHWDAAPFFYIMDTDFTHVFIISCRILYEGLRGAIHLFCHIVDQGPVIQN